jgi:hypothetical protein
MWAVELAGFQLDFQPRHAIRSQVLADFIAEWTPTPSVPGVRTMVRTLHLRKSGLRCSPDPTGCSSLTRPHTTRMLELVWSLSTQMANK